MTKRSTRLVALGSAGLCVLIAVTGLLWNFESWSPGCIEQSKRRADPIIAAIEAYFAARGQFPATLEILVPEYLRELPRPTAGTRKWHYGVCEGAFWLSFCCGPDDYPNCTYSSSSREWIEDH